MDMVGKNMIMSFRSLEDMITYSYSKIVKEQQTFRHTIVEKMKQVMIDKQLLTSRRMVET